MADIGNGALGATVWSKTDTDYCHKFKLMKMRKRRTTLPNLIPIEKKYDEQDSLHDTIVHCLLIKKLTSKRYKQRYKH